MNSSNFLDGVSANSRTIVFTSVENPSSDLMMIENFR